MGINSDVNHVELPRARVGGLKQGPVEELLQRISQDFRTLQLEKDRLSAANERLAVGSERLSSIVEQLETRAAAAAQRAEQGSHRDGDEGAAAVLAVALRAARALRESTRTDCERMLRKVQSQARKLELDLERERAAASAEIEELRGIRRELRETMRASLEGLLEAIVVEQSGGSPGLSSGAARRMSRLHY